VALATTTDYTRPGTLARRLVDYVVLAVAPDVPLAAADYWEASVAAYLDMRDFVAAAVADAAVAGDGAAEAAYLALLRDPGAADRIRALRPHLARLIERDPGWGRVAARLAAEADERIWIDHWLGDGAGDEPEIDLVALPVPGRPASSDSGRSRIDVIIAFRDAERGPRLRNLIACLRALADQDPVDAAVRVTLVEADTSDRSRAEIEPLADRYLQVYKDGRFNKSWTVNVGLRDARRLRSGHARQLVCVLDADILVERSFLAVNLARFEAPGHRAHLPFRWSLSLDGPATRYAIRRRIADAAASVDVGRLRGLLLREPPGGCLWADSDLLHGIGGFDERFEGWGGEDDDVIGRVAEHTTLLRFDDALLHLDHPRPEMTREDGAPINAHLLGSHHGEQAWTGAHRYGDPDRFSPVAGAVTAAAEPVSRP
jgi:hypothetical protein